MRLSSLTSTLLLACASVSVCAQAPARVDRAAHHEFVIADFRTESGVVLPAARVVYGTYGHLNAAHDNAILLPSHYMATHHGYEWLIGPGRALDTTRYFLVATELFGNGHSSSPSNTPEPFHGPRFPVTTIRDNVAAVKRLLASDLGPSQEDAEGGLPRSRDRRRGLCRRRCRDGDRRRRCRGAKIESH